MTPDFVAPSHLAPAAKVIDRLLTPDEKFILCLSASPRHGKSQLVFHTIARYLLQHPKHLVAYCCYAADLAESRSRNDIRPLCARAGVELDNQSRAAGEWRTKQGGGLLARGTKGAITGQGANLLVIDDPLRDRVEAESPTIRNSVYDWFTSTAFSRGEPNMSVICTHTRWCPDDLIGRIISENPDLCEYVNLPAIRADGTALWSERYTLADLERIRRVVGEYDWASLYMGSPRPRGSGVFHDTHCYERLPDKLKIAVGIDLAYTQKTYSDWSVAVVLGQDPSTKIVYVLDVVRKQCSAPEFISSLKALLAARDWPPVFTYIGGTERGVVDFFVTQGVKVHAEAAKADKFVRAQPVAAAWNAGKVLVPKTATEWGSAFTSELLSFTGVGDKHDDQVDALAGAFHKLTVPPPARGVGLTPIFPF